MGIALVKTDWLFGIGVSISVLQVLDRRNTPRRSALLRLWLNI